MPINAYTKVNLKTGKIHSKLATQYPSAWCAAYPGVKPTAVAKKYDLNAADLKKTLIKGVEDGNINRDLAKFFLASKATEIKAKLDDDWTTYSVVIKKKGEDVAISDIIDIKIDDKQLKDFSVGVTSSTGTDKDLIMTLLFIHRLTRLSSNAPIETYIENMKKQFDSKDSGLVRGLTRLSENTNWQSDKDYNKLVAAYDMFFFRFPDHPLASVRYGSVGSRFRDCVALASFGQTAEVLGVTTDELAKWVFNIQVGNELDSIFADSDFNESMNQYSYFPYQVDLGLVQKSAYSSVAAPQLYFFCHAIGSFLRSKRAMNARLNTENNLHTLVKNALIVASAYSDNTELKKVYTTTGEEFDEAGALGQLGAIEEDAETIPRDADEAYHMMLLRSFRPTDRMKAMLNTYKREVKETRDGTIGKYLTTFSF